MNVKNYLLRPKNKSCNSIDLNFIKNQSNYDEIITNIFQKQKENHEIKIQQQEKNNAEYIISLISLI